MPTNWLSLFWYRLLLGLAGRLRHPQAQVRLADCARSVELHYHLLGGDLTQRVIADDGGRHPLKPSTHGAADLMAWLDREQIHLPTSINRYANASLNQELYFWLAAFLALDKPPAFTPPPPTGLRHLLGGAATVARVLRHFPGLAGRYQRLCAAELAQRQAALPQLGTGSPQVHQLEAGIRFCLGSGQPPSDLWLRDAISAAQESVIAPPNARWRDYPTPFLPVPLWGRPSGHMPGLQLRWLKRQQRRTASGRKKTLNAPRFDAQHHPRKRRGQPDHGEFTYHEWDYRVRGYRENWCRVEEHTRQEKRSRHPGFDTDTDALSRQVRRQFEALRLSGGWRRMADHGEDIDLDAYVGAVADKRKLGWSTSALYRSSTFRSRDLSVAIVLDTSRSTEAWVGTQRVIEIARQSVGVMAEALAGIGDDFALFGFSSDSRRHVRCDCIKGFPEAYGPRSRRALLALKPANYTRMGAAIRHVGAKLQARASRQKVLLVLTDGKPHDPTDGYEGRYAVADTRRALQELRAQGVSGFGLAIDHRGRDHLPALFGPGHYALLSHPQALPSALPRLYARITAAAA